MSREHSFGISWSEATSMPEPRDGYAAGVIDKRLIVIGGTYWEGEHGAWTRKVFSSSVHSFEPRTGIWKSLDDAPMTLAYPASAQVDEVVYVIGGLHNGRPSREVYTVRKSGPHLLWWRCTPLPEERLFSSAVAMGKKIYVIGGVHEFEPFDEAGHCCTSRSATKTLWVLDTAEASPTWRTLSDYPGELRWLHTAETDGAAIYLFGGIQIEARNSPAKKINDVLRYEPSANSWTIVGNLPKLLQVATPVRIRKNVLLVSGSKPVMLFDPVDASFSPLDPLPEAVRVSRFVSIDSLLVGAGGESSSEGPRRRSNRTFIGSIR